jgi:Tfp pilus assembly pilus retraction ATPase PilT
VKILRPLCSASWILPLLLLALPSAVQAQFNYTTNNGTITITGYTGSGDAITIPNTINVGGVLARGHLIRQIAPFCDPPQHFYPCPTEIQPFRSPSHA